MLTFLGLLGTFGILGFLAFLGIAGLAATTAIAAFALYIIFILIFYVFVVIGSWKVFEKAGEPGWKALIPIYNLYILYKISWNGYMFFAELVLGMLAGCFSHSAVGSLFAILSTVIAWVMYYKLSKSFGHGIVFTVFMILFPQIAQIILGFDDSQYIKA